MEKKLQGIIGKTKARVFAVEKGQAFIDTIEQGVSLKGGIQFPLEWADGVYNVKGASRGLTIAEDKNAFPPMEAWPTIAEICNHEILADLAKFLPVVAISVSDDEMRYFMNGVCFQRETIISTDGRTLSYHKTPGNLWMDDGIKEFIVPYTAPLAYALKNFTLAKIQIRQAPGTSKTEFAFLFAEFGLAVSCYCIEGQFPMWERVVPDYKESEKVSLVLPTKEEMKNAELLAKLSKNSDWLHNGARVVLKDAQGRSVGFNSLFVKRAIDSGIDSLRGVETTRAWVGGKPETVAFIVMPMEID